MDIFVIKDANGKHIRLSKERWAHITQEHQDIKGVEDIKEVLLQPTVIRPSDSDPDHVKWFYKFDKEEKLYLLVSVKYLNGEGFIITAYYTTRIKWKRKFTI